MSVNEQNPVILEIACNYSQKNIATKTERLKEPQSSTLKHMNFCKT